MNVLYLDDEADLLELAQIFFREHGIHVDTFTSPTAALERAAHKIYDVVLSDARMPEMSGLVFHTRLRQELGFRGRFLLVSGHCDFSDRSEIPVGIDGVILKPVEFEQLLREILK